jgi:DNA-binding GntR family transcriptional regulator
VHSPAKSTGVVMAYIATIIQAVGSANGTEQAILRLTDPRAPVLRVTRIRFDDDGHPHAHEDVVLPLDMLPSLAASGGDVPDIADLAQRHGLKLGRASERVSIAPATADIARNLSIPPGTVVLKLDRVTETANGEPIEWRVAFARKRD